MQDRKNTLYSISLYCGAFTIVDMWLAGAAYASPMAEVICLLVDWFQGNLGAGIASIGVSAVAIGAIFGKVSWGLALTVAVGVSAMFGATDILYEAGVIQGSPC